MGLGWIDPRDYGFRHFMLLERFQIRMMLDSRGWRNEKEEWRRDMGAALNAHPDIKWYLGARCPERAGILSELAAGAREEFNAEELMEAEARLAESIEDFMVYTTPERMAEQCDFIAGWERRRLYEMADFAGKVVLDVGAGSGRLAFAAAELAREVYAVEPVGTLREYMRERIRTEGIRNVRVTDGMADSLAYPDGMFDIVMSGHVVGDDYEGELRELERVVKSGGWILDCPGDSRDREMRPSEEALGRGYEQMDYIGTYGKTIMRYRKRIVK